MKEQELRECLSAKMNDVTLASLPEFIAFALEQGGAGYGEICIALGAIAAAAAKAADRSPQGGITGFQASAVFWEFVHHWGVFSAGPKRMLTYSEMLYPQYEYKFQTISSETWEWLQSEARRRLAEDHEYADPVVIAHWESIAQGAVPFGFTVERN